MSFKSMKRPMSFAFGAIVALVLGAFHAHARSPELLNQRLYDTLKERSQVEKTYGSNDAAARPSAISAREATERIEVEMNPELGGSGRSQLRDHDNPNRIYREARIEARLEEEADAIEHDLPLVKNPFDSHNRRRLPKEHN